MAPRLAVVILLIAMTFNCAAADPDWSEAAQLLARYAKWRAAAEAQQHAVQLLGEPTTEAQRRQLDAARLLLAHYRLRAGDVVEAVEVQPSPIDTAILESNALHASGRSAEALERLNAWTAENSNAAFNAANISWDIGAREDAVALYRRAIELAEKREEEFRAIVSQRRPNLTGPLRGIMLGAQRLPQVSAPAARNNLGHLLLEMAGENAFDPMLLVEAQRQFLAASRNPDYETPQFAYLGRARADLRGGEPAEALKSLASALWADSAYENALALAATLTTDERPEVAAKAASMLLPALRESLPKRFIDARYGEVLTATAARLRDVDAEPAHRFSAAYAMHEGDLDGAATQLEAARSRYAHALWPTALLAQATAEKGDSARALELFRTLDTNAIENGTAAPLEGIALREALIAYSEVASKQGTTADVARTENLIASLFESGSSATLAYAVPWEQTSRITGMLRTADGLELPGVNITVISEDGRVKTAFTGEDGTYSIAVRPGTYSVTAELSGMNTVKRSIDVGWDAERLDVAMDLGSVKDVITVSADAPPIVQTADLTTSIMSEQIESLPSVNRPLWTFLEPTPGTQISVNGASMRTNTFLIDGANTSETLFTAGTLQEPSLSIAEVLEFRVAGQTASHEYGVLRMDTKSGHDQLEIKSDDTTQPESFREEALPVTVPYERQHDVRQLRGNVSVGGPLRRGRLWLFALGEVDDVRGSGGIDRLPSEKRNLEGFAKLSAALTENIQPNLAFHHSEEERHGALNDVAGSLYGSETATNRDATHDTTSAILSAFALPSPRLSINAGASMHRDESTLRPRSSDGEAMQNRIASSGLLATGGVGFINDGRVFRRNSANVNVMAFFRSGDWTHEIRGGGTYDDEEDTLHDRLSGGFMVEHLPDDRVLTRYWGDAEDLPVTAVRETFTSELFSVYLQDQVKYSRFTINAGLRWTRQPIEFPSGAQMATAVLQPRLNITFDPWGTERSKFFATFGRFAETLGADERVAMGSKRRYVVSEESSLSPPTPLLRAYGSLAAIDPDLRGRYEDEITAGFGRSIGYRMFFTVTGIRRRLQSDIQDFFCTTDLRRCIGNRETRRELDAIDLVMTSTRQTLPRDTSVSWGVHYVWSRRTGNVEDPDLAATRTLGIDPYSRIAFDLPELVAPNGPLSRDRRNTARAYGVLSLFKERLIVSASTWWHTGESRARFGYSELYGRYAYYLSARGAEGRSPSAWDGDARIAYDFKPWKKSLQVAFTIENVRNRQINTIDDQRWNFSESTSSLNGEFLQPMERIAPRTMQISAKFQY